MIIWQNLGCLGGKSSKSNPKCSRNVDFLKSTFAGLQAAKQTLRAPRLRIARFSMSSDEIVWQVINQQFCSFKLKFVPPASSSFTTNNLEPQKRRISAAMNIMSLVSAIANPALSRTHAMLLSAQTQTQGPCTSI